MTFTIHKYLQLNHGGHMLINLPPSASFNLPCGPLFTFSPSLHFFHTISPLVASPTQPMNRKSNNYVFKCSAEQLLGNSPRKGGGGGGSRSRGSPFDSLAPLTPRAGEEVPP